MRPRYSSALNPRDYRPLGRSGTPSVVFGELVYDEPRGLGLLQAKVVEDQFIQEFHIRLKRLPDGRFKLAPALVGQVLPTAGVALALDLAAAAGAPGQAGEGAQAGPARGGQAGGSETTGGQMAASFESPGGGA
jgi:hypothetical protein